jgi:hypothetical protein
MDKMKKYGKLIIFDSLAVLCFIGVILFGWLPGPGGIPLFILGLSLLAVNHDWAERWMETAKHKGVSIKKWLFPKNQWVRAAYDITAIGLFAVGGYLLLTEKHRLVQGMSVMLMMVSLFVFLINRDRFDKFSILFRRKP